MVVEIKYQGNKPEKGRKQDAANDLRAAEGGYVLPGKHAAVETGTYMSLPVGYAGLVLSRSGLAHKFGVRVKQGVGLIDPDYTGDVTVLLENTGKESFYYEAGDRIAQLLIIETADVKFVKTNKDLEASARGDQGFGSSGRK